MIVVSPSVADYSDLVFEVPQESFQVASDVFVVPVTVAELCFVFVVWI
jgi:hypothetical protein